ncbi:hypothetical protein QBA75_10205 [Streptomyces stelliscabiei]
MHGLQRGEHLQPEGGRVPGGERSALGDPAGQRRPRDEFHDDPQPVLRLDQVMDAHHMRVRYPGDRAGLPDRPAHPDAVLLVAVGEDVQFLGGDGTVQQLVMGAPDRAHTASAENLVEQIPAGDQPFRTVLRTCRRLVVAVSGCHALSHVSFPADGASTGVVARSVRRHVFERREHSGE